MNIEMQRTYHTTQQQYNMHAQQFFGAQTLKD